MSPHPVFGCLVRHPDSPGMTILQRDGDSSSLPFGVKNFIGGEIELVRPSSVILDIVGGKREDLRLLKVDAEGHELHSFRGADLHTFTFEYLTFEFFPELLIKAGNTNPLELLLYIN